MRTDVQAGAPLPQDVCALIASKRLGEVARLQCGVTRGELVTVRGQESGAVSCHLRRPGEIRFTSCDPDTCAHLPMLGIVEAAINTNQSKQGIDYEARSPEDSTTGDVRDCVGSGVPAWP